MLKNTLKATVVKIAIIISLLQLLFVSIDPLTYLRTNRGDYLIPAF